jgi:hypothetical protein
MPKKGYRPIRNKNEGNCKQKYERQEQTRKKITTKTKENNQEKRREW